MSIDYIKPAISQFSPIEKPRPIIGDQKVKETPGQESFSDMFTNAIKEVDNLQKEADTQIEGLTLGKEGVTTHGAMLALEKADVAFQLMNSIRTKIIRAYEDVIRTQV